MFQCRLYILNLAQDLTNGDERTTGIPLGLGQLSLLSYRADLAQNSLQGRLVQAQHAHQVQGLLLGSVSVFAGCSVFLLSDTLYQLTTGSWILSRLVDVGQSEEDGFVGRGGP